MSPRLERLAELRQHPRLERDPRLAQTEHERVGHLDGIADRAHRLHSADQLFEEHPDLESGETGTEAEVGADTESEGVVGPSGPVEASGVIEVRRIAVGRAVEEYHLLAGTDRHAADVVVASGHAAHVVNRCHPADELLDRYRKVRAVAQQLP